MKALVLGIAVILVAVMAVLPVGLNWWGDVLIFLRGGLPVLAVFISLIMIFIGISDLKDKFDAKKESKNETPNESQ